MNVMEARRRTLGGGVYEKTVSGETVLANGSLARRYPGIHLYGQSTQASTTGAQLFDISKVISRPRRLENNGDSLHVTTISGDAAASGGVPNTLRDYAPNLKAGQTYYLSAASTGTDKYIHIGEIWNFNSSKVITEEMLQRTVMFYASGEETEADISEIMICEGTTAKPFEPYTGGAPSPSPDYPQEIVSKAEDGNVEVEMYGGNLLNSYGWSAQNISNPSAARKLTNNYGTTISSIDPVNEVEVTQEIIGENPSGYKAGYFCIGIDDVLEVGKNYIISFDWEIKSNPLDSNKISILVNGTREASKVIDGSGRVSIHFTYSSYGERSYIEFRNEGMSVVVRNVMVTPESAGEIPYEPSKTPQTLTVSTPNGLPGIPVTSGGNYTDETGQQWVCDEVDFKRGVYVKRIGSYEFTGDEGSDNVYYPIVIVSLPNSSLYGNPTTYGTKSIMSNSATSNDIRFSNLNGRDIGFFNAQTFWGAENNTELMGLLKNKHDAGNPVKIIYPLATPIETPLTPAELSAYAGLHTNYPTTTVSNDEVVYMSLDYKTKKSLEVN